MKSTRKPKSMANRLSSIQKPFISIQTKLMARALNAKK